MIDELPAVLKAAREAGDSVCVLLTDIDDFKSINDSYGHLTGDIVLEKFAQIMQSSLRRDDISIRYGGDEFVAMLLRVSIDQAKAVAERFRERVSRERFLPDGDPVTISIGLAECREDDDLLSLFCRARMKLSMLRKNRERTGLLPFSAIVISFFGEKMEG